MIFVVRDTTTSPPALWSVLSDIAAWPDILDTYTSVTQVDGPTPTDVGSRFEVQQPGLKTATYEVTAWEAGQRFTWIGRTPGVMVTATHTVIPLSDGARLELGLEMSGPMAWLARRLLARKAQRYVEAEAAGLIRFAEAR